MRVLWYVNAMPAFFRTGASQQPYYITGGWIDGMLEALSRRIEPAPDGSPLSMTVCWPSIGNAAPAAGESRGVSFCTVPVKGVYRTPYEPEAEAAFVALIQHVRPQVIHIFGAETPHALALARAAGSLGMAGHILTHIQGVSYLCAREYAAGLPQKAFSRATLRDRLRHDGMRCQQAAFYRQGEYEKELLGLTRHAGVRTHWDRAAVLSVNPRLICHRCNENLRDLFYTRRWDRRASTPYSIFVSQGNYPLKGLHFLLEALPAVLAAYPGAHVTVAGGDPTRSGEGLRGRLSRGGYGAYIARRIRALGLKNAVTFAGVLDGEGMCRQYLSAQVLVSPSYLENSPNSVGEAMLLGLPVVATDAGGTSSVLADQREGLLVPLGDAALLAEAIVKVFNSPAEADARAENARRRALHDHDRHKNMEELMETYNQVSQTGRLLYERRIWGEYRVLDESQYPDGSRTLVKHITLDPGKNISYQKHAHRDEVWTIAAGTGEFVLDGQRRTVAPGDVLIIKKTQLHTIRADARCCLHLIEVQAGDLLEETDIQRFDYQW